MNEPQSVPNQPSYVAISIYLNIAENKPVIVLLDAVLNIEVAIDPTDMIESGYSVGVETAWIAGYLAGYSDKQHDAGVSIPESLVAKLYRNINVTRTLQI